jgi:hypothetical protein
MGNYSEDEDSVRVDFFKPSGKWYTTEAIRWTCAYRNDELKDGKIQLLPDLLRDLLQYHLTRNVEKLGTIRLAGMWAICLEPYHEAAYPLMVRVPGCYECGMLVCTTVHQKDIL